LLLYEPKNNNIPFCIIVTKLSEND